MRSVRGFAFTLAFALVLSAQAGCSDRASQTPGPPPAAERPPASSAAAAGPQTPPSTAPAAAPGTKTAAASPETSPPPGTQPAAVPESRSQPPIPPPAAAPATPATRIEVAVTKPGTSRVGADKCKMCHKLEYDSWAASKHAAQSPALDCESCHGQGSEYKTLAVMKDPAKAKQAGLVIPGKEFCAICHQAGWSDEMIAKAHAHKQE